MAHFARLDENNIVTMVVVVSNEDMIDEQGNENEARGIAVCEQVVGPGPWVQTSYNGNFRKQYAGLGYTYDAANDVFISIKPYSSWVLNDTFGWVAPKPYPSDGKNYGWDEEKKNWVEIVPPAEA